MSTPQYRAVPNATAVKISIDELGGPGMFEVQSLSSDVALQPTYRTDLTPADGVAATSKYGAVHRLRIEQFIEFTGTGATTCIVAVTREGPDAPGE